MKDCIVLITGFFCLMIAFVLVGYECISDQQREIQRLEAELAAHSEYELVLEKKITDAEKHMDNIVRCVVSGEW